MIPLDRPLTRQQGVVLAGRVLCVFFLFWSVCNLSYLPGDVIGLLHYVHQGEGALGVRYYGYWTNRYVGFISGAVLRAALELWVAGLFYRCGPKIGGFLLPLDTEIEGG
jgi:hypothetical protein